MRGAANTPHRLVASAHNNWYFSGYLTKWPLTTLQALEGEALRLKNKAFLLPSIPRPPSCPAVRPVQPRAAYPLAEGDPKGALAGVRNGSRATWGDEHRARSPRRGEAEGLGVRLGEAGARNVAPARVGGTTEVGTRGTLLAQAPHAGRRETGVFFSVVFVGREKGRANRRSNCPQQNKKTRSNTT